MKQWMIDAVNGRPYYIRFTRMLGVPWIAATIFAFRASEKRWTACAEYCIPSKYALPEAWAEYESET